MLEKVKLAFGKVDPNQFGVLPVLVVIQNDSDKAIRLDHLKIEYVGANREHVDTTPAKEVRYLKGPDRPNVITGPAGNSEDSEGKKNPLDAWEIEGRSFSAQILPPGQSASGFFISRRRCSTAPPSISTAFTKPPPTKNSSTSNCRCSKQLQ